MKTAVLVAALAATLGGCKSKVPSSLLLTVTNGPTAAPPDQVRVRVFDAIGQAAGYVAFSAPAPGADYALGTVVIYPRSSAPAGLSLRIQAQGWRQQVQISQGTARVQLADGKQSEAAIILAPWQPGAAGDGDGDGVPEEIDNCPTVANPGQDDSDGDGNGDSNGSSCAAGDGGLSDASTDGYIPTRPLAAACTGSAECESGFCVDGVCCESACVDVCRSCKLTDSEGRCSPLPAGVPDPRGGCSQEAAATCGFDGACNGAGGCRRHPAGTVCRPGACSGVAGERTLPGTCDGNGVCSEPRAQSCMPYACVAGECRATCSGPADCAPGSTCTSGSCGKRALGATCAQGLECNSGNCVDGVCCDVAECGGPCRACNVTGLLGSCQNMAASADPRAGGCLAEAVLTCGRTGKCDGKGGCQLQAEGTPCGARVCTGATETGAPSCNGTGTCVPGTARSCGTYACLDGDACRTSCASDGDCQSAAACVGGRCVLRRAMGAACSQAAECMSGFCNDGVCCNTACTEPCRRCDGDPLGTCQLVTTGRDSNSTPSCGPPRRCIAGGACE